jgi:hypothetical protein
LAIGGALAAIAVLDGKRVRQLVGLLIVVLAIGSPLSPIAQRPLQVWAVVHRSPWSDSRLPLEVIGPTEAVSAVQPVVPLLSHRSTIYSFPNPFRADDPAGIGHSPSAAVRVSVVVVLTTELRLAEQLGFTRVVYEDATYVIARKPAG